MTHSEKIQRYEISLAGKGLSVGIVLSRFNAGYGEALLAACVDELGRLGVCPTDIVLFSVPGALEIPLTLQRLANTRRFDALIALGAVIRGETHHFEIVANASCRGVMEVQLDTGVPIANGILTCYDEAQADARTREKGTDCARVAVEMANLFHTLRAKKA
jgi:6,7-dimethyl-8-ribityllumazine synthase